MTDPTPSPLDLRHLQGLHEAATPGPWERHPNRHRGINYLTLPGWGSTSGPGTGAFAEVDSDTDASLIAASRNALPSLIAAGEVALALRKHARHLPRCLAGEAGPGCTPECIHPCSCGLDDLTARLAELIEDREGEA